MKKVLLFVMALGVPFSALAGDVSGNLKQPRPRFLERDRALGACLASEKG